MIEKGMKVTTGETDGVVVGYNRKNDIPYWGVQWDCHAEGYINWYEPWMLKKFIPVEKGYIDVSDWVEWNELFKI